MTDLYFPYLLYIEKIENLNNLITENNIIT